MGSNSRLEIAATVAASIAAIASAIAAGLSVQAANTANDRVQLQDTRQFANKVYVGEAPRYAYDVMGVPADGIWWVVMNPTGVQIDRLWVEGRDGRSIVIEGVQRCTMYALARGFIPIALHFTDAYGKWRRPVEGQLDHEYREMPTRGTHNSPWDMDIKDCAG